MGRPASRRVQFTLAVADPRWSQVIAQCLQAQGYLVLTAASVREASEKLAVEPSLMIVEARLPDASGWDLLTWLARCGRETPAVIIGAPERSAPRGLRWRPLLILPPSVALETVVRIVQEYFFAPGTAYGA